MYCQQIYLATLAQRKIAQKMLRNVTFVIQIAYFCIRPNTRRETKTVKFLLFVATFGQLPLQKATFFGSTYSEISSNFWQALLTDRQLLFKHGIKAQLQ